jgi:hypothetical protein
LGNYDPHGRQPSHCGRQYECGYQSTVVFADAENIEANLVGEHNLFQQIL